MEIPIWSLTLFPLVARPPTPEEEAELAEEEGEVPINAERREIRNPRTTLAPQDKILESVIVANA
jgi:hypothetical protein